MVFLGQTHPIGLLRLCIAKGAALMEDDVDELVTVEFRQTFGHPHAIREMRQRYERLGFLVRRVVGFETLGAIINKSGSRLVFIQIPFDRFSETLFFALLEAMVEVENKGKMAFWDI